MINLINIKSILVQSLFIAGVFLLISSCSENKSPDSREIAEKENIAKMTSDNKTIVVVKNDKDIRFLMDAAELQLEEISLGKLAQQKGMSSQVKELGKRMEEDHNQSLSELRAMAKSKSVSIPTTITNDSKDKHEKLNKKTGADFDKAYCKMMVKHHEDAVDLFEKASKNSENAEIRVWASRKLPVLKTHLKHAKACESNVN